ncbi:MAG: aminopeptidase [Chloroflexi bacterium RBG_16_51_9]|nr:MAG: aminopeptidase [Chloroflexi bacterium RBG_16_51_9]
MNTANRLQKLRQSIAEKELDGVFISQEDNRYYLSGFGGSAGYLLITQKETILATDFRYYEQVKVQAPDYRLFQITGPLADWFHRLIDGLNLKRLGFEGGDVTFNLYKQLSDAVSEAQLSLQLIATDGLIETLRAVKEPEEIELITKAVEITDKAFAHLEGLIAPGMTELEVAWELEKFQREQGSQAMPFDVIIASGPEAALPHHKASERKIKAGEPIVIDFGARVGGYGSDFTRTLCLGKPDDTFRKVHDTVLGAQLAAIALIKEGVVGSEADSYARTVIKEAGYGELFGHSLGHGVGLAEHEMPRLGPNSTDILVSGMVFSVEPGIYLPGWGGVRIEDLAVIENAKLKILSKGRK